MCREQPSSPGTSSPTSVKATLQQPTGQADKHAVPPQWSLGDFSCGWVRPSPASAFSMSSQHASGICPATADGKTSHAAIHPVVSSSAQSAVSHSSAQQCSKSAGQDTVQDAPPQFCIGDFGMRKAVPSRVQTPSMTSIQHASGTGAKLPPQAPASATIPPSTHVSAKTAQTAHTTVQMCTRPTAHDKRSLANNVAPKTSSQNGSQMSTKPQISTKPSQRQIAEEKASGTEQSAPVNSQATSDIRTDPTRQLASNQISLADDLPPLGVLKQPEQPAAKKSTRHSPIAHGASAHTHASSKKSASNKSADAANKTSSTSLRAAHPQVIAQATTKATSAPDNGSSAPVHGTTAATKSARSVATDAALPTKHATAAANISTEAAASSKSATASGRAAKAPTKDTTSGVVSPTASVNGATAPVKGATTLIKGATAPVKRATAPIKGATAPIKGATAPVKGATAPIKGATAPIKDATAPIKGATLKDARGARERNTQASALNIASTSSGTPANAFTDAPAADTSSTSVNLPDPNARPFYGSDSSDDFQSASSDAAELRSSRLSPYSSPSQASTGSSYTTARSQTSSNSQASNHHSQLAGMTSAAAAPAAVSSSSQGVKQASMARMQVPLPAAEQRHNANAERGQVTQVGQHSSRPPVRSQSAHVEPEQPAQAERRYRPQRVHQYQPPSQACHLASAEPRHYAQAERDHASRPLDRVRLVTAEPGHDAQAEHQSRTQGCKPTSRPYISPQTVNIKPLKDIPAECDFMSSTHPGLGSGVELNDPSDQAGLEEPVHSLDDALSNALQELLLTQDRQDFALSIQVGGSVKSICFLHMSQKILVISVLFSPLSSEIRVDTQSWLPCFAYLFKPCCAESQSAEQQSINS